VNTGYHLRQTPAHSRVNFSDQVIREFSLNPGDQDLVCRIEFKSKTHPEASASAFHPNRLTLSGK
jgi:hypothetical protein